jgi:hypothetical protein
MKCFLIRLLALSFCLPSFWAQSQGFPEKGQEDCLSQIRKLYQDIQERIHLAGDKVFYLEFTVTTTLGEEYGNEKHQTTARLYANGHKSMFTSSEIEVYQDSSLTISIISDKKRIYLMDYRQHESKKAALQNIALFQDSLFALSSVTYCEEIIREDGSKHKKIRLAVNENGQRLFQVKTLEFLIDADKNLVKHTTVTYVKPFYIHQVSVSYQTIDFDYSSGSLANNFLSLILDRQGKLQNKYQDYQLIDSRGKSQ